MSERDSGLTPDMESDALIASTLGGFRLTSLLGAGGMAEVYCGYDLQLQRDVAVKVLLRHVARDPRYVARFRNEAQRVAALHHPNVVPIFHFGEERGLLYLVMPVLKESLRDRITREGTLDPVETIFLTIEVAMALDTAHSQGLVHRDVKPENILMNDEGRPLLSDFGIAREVEVLRDPTAARTLATSGMPVGTPAYMAPELLRGSTADHRVDVYSLGIVLYEMLAGRLPHEGVTAFDVAARALTEAPLPPTHYNPAIWPELEEVVLGAMASDPDQRYPDMSNLVEALRQAALARSTGVSMGLMGAPLARVPNSTHPGLLVPAGLPRYGDLAPAGDTVAGAWQDRHGVAGVIATYWRDSVNLGRRRRVLLMAAAAVVLVLALVASGAGGVLFALHAIPSVGIGQGAATGTATGMPTTDTTGVPTTGTTGMATTGTTGMPTTGPSASPSVRVEHTPTVLPTVTGAPVPSATATPLLTPTMVVSASPLNFQLSQDRSHCQAVQKLTNISAVDAQWSWTNAPGASGWQYNISGFNGTWLGWPGSGALSTNTPANSSVYVYIQTGQDSYGGVPCTEKTHTNPLVATISVTSGTGTHFNVTY